MYTKKTIRAGNIVFETLYPSFNRWDTAETRRLKSALRTKANRAKNDKTARRRGLIYLAHNFNRPAQDSVATFTFSDKWLPRSYAEVSARMESYFRLIRPLASRVCGETLKYFYVIEHTHGEGRFHVHMVWNVPMKEKARVLRLWPYGEKNNQEMKPLERDSAGHITYTALSEYMTKEAQDDRPVGAYMWHKSRNVVYPKETTEQVPDDYHISQNLPANAFVLEREDKLRADRGGRYEYAMYYLPALSKQEAENEKICFEKLIEWSETGSI